MIKKFTSALLLASLFLIGCSPSTEEDQQTTGATGYVKNLAKAKNNSQATAITTSLNKAIQQFEALEGELPKTLDELVTKDYLSSIPEAPLNMKIEYDNKTGTVTLLPR